MNRSIKHVNNVEANHNKNTPKNQYYDKQYNEQLKRSILQHQINQQLPTQFKDALNFQMPRLQQQQSSNSPYALYEQFNQNKKRESNNMFSSQISQNEQDDPYNKMNKSTLSSMSSKQGSQQNSQIKEGSIIKEGSQIKDNSTAESRAQGCLFGAFLGDTMGSKLEFFKGQITEYLVHDAFNLPGGGIHKVTKGQLTDDGELAIMLSQGILETDQFDVQKILEKVLQKYHSWIESGPFDFGNTMQESWNPIMFKKWDYLLEMYKNPSYIVKLVQDHVRKSTSSKSQSNGFLMKQAPLGIFLWEQKASTIFQFAEQETLLTHSDQYCIDVSKLYLYMITQLIKRGRKDSFQIYTECRSFAWQDRQFCLQTKENFIMVEKCFEGLKESDLSSGKKSYNYKVPSQIPFFNDIKQVGWVKIAFSYCLYLLLNDQVKLDEMFKQLLRNGGDTDTNLCIIGSIIGAMRGIEEFSSEHIQIIQNCDPIKSAQQRPRDFAPGQYKTLAKQLFEKAEKIKSGSQIKGNSGLQNNKINAIDLLINENKTEMKQYNIKVIKNCTIDLLEDCNIERIENSFIKQMKSCTIKDVKQSRFYEMSNCQIYRLDHCIFQDTQVNIDKKNNKIVQKSDSVFGVYLL